MSERNAPIYVRIGIEDKQVLLLFTKDPEGGIPANTSKWVLDPNECQIIAGAMADAAFEADTSLKPLAPTQKAARVELHRDVLIPRIANMLGSLREDRLKSNGELALAFVDVMCAEVFK